MMLPKYIYKISNHDKTTFMSCRFRDATYNVAFLFKEHPKYIVPHISEDSKIEIADYNTHNDSILRIEKKININKLSCSVTHDEFTNFLAGIFNQNVGGIMIYDMVSEDKDEYLFESQILDPKYDPKVFAQNLNKTFLDN